MISVDSIRLVSYFSAAQLYDEGKDLYDCFLVLGESILAKNGADRRSIRFELLHREINERLALNIPAATLEYFLQKLRRNQKIEYDKQRIIRIIDNETVLNFREKLEQNRNKIESFCCIRTRGQ